MKKDEEEILREFLEPVPGVSFHDIMNINYRPHPFTIGPEHIANSPGMYLDPDSAPCAVRGCKLSYKEHTSDRVLFLRATVDSEELSQAMEPYLGELASILKDNSIDGITFIDRREKENEEHNIPGH